MSDTHNQAFETLQPLFHAEMLYHGGEAITSPQGKVGEYIGCGAVSGSGTVWMVNVPPNSPARKRGSPNQINIPVVSASKSAMLAIQE